MSKLILVVDDEPDLRASIRNTLEGRGYAVTEAANANAAQKAIGVEAPDLILTDIFMPFGDGFELLTALRQRGGVKIPVVAMSGRIPSGAMEPLEYAGKMGAVAVLDKPFHPRELLEVIGRIIAGEGTSQQ